MNKLVLLASLFLLFQSLACQAQSFLKDAPKSKQDLRLEKSNCRPYYIGLSSGLNNIGGLLGVDFEYAWSNITTAGAHIGLGTWGIKTGIDAKYYRRECHLGWAYGLGLSLAGGYRNQTLNLETIAGQKKVSLNLFPQAGLQLEIMRFFPIGKQGHRIWVEAGWNQRLTRKVYSVLDGQTLTLMADKTINLICPGGLVIATGYAMGIGGKKRKS